MPSRPGHGSRGPPLASRPPPSLRLWGSSATGNASKRGPYAQIELDRPVGAGGRCRHGAADLGPFPGRPVPAAPLAHLGEPGRGDRARAPAAARPVGAPALRGDPSLGKRPARTPAAAGAGAPGSGPAAGDL